MKWFLGLYTDTQLFLNFIRRLKHESCCFLFEKTDVQPLFFSLLRVTQSIFHLTKAVPVDKPRYDSCSFTRLTSASTHDMCVPESLCVCVCVCVLSSLWLYVREWVWERQRQEVYLCLFLFWEQPLHHAAGDHIWAEQRQEQDLIGSEACVCVCVYDIDAVNNEVIYKHKGPVSWGPQMYMLTSHFRLVLHTKK